MLATWDAECADPYPLTITHGRDGLDFVAFPLSLDEVPGDVAERVDAIRWFMSNSEAPFGRGPTPEVALADLRARAREVQIGPPTS